MNGSEIASLVLNTLGSLGPLAAKLIGAGKEESMAILADMRAEVEKASELLRKGGAMDDSFATEDAKLDLKIAKADGTLKMEMAAPVIKPPGEDETKP